MKKLQDNFTTPEQSKRLLELGVPADSADFHYTRFGTILWHHNQGDIDFNNSDSIPVWSVGRLIEIVDLCEKRTIAYQNVEMHEDCNPEELTKILTGETGREFDFSKLED